MLWAIFKDHRGVAYCEPADQGIWIFGRYRAGVTEKRQFLTGKVIREARQGEWSYATQFDPKYKRRDDFNSHAFDRPPSGYIRMNNRTYLVNNHWGLVEVIAWMGGAKKRDVGKDRLERRLQYAFRMMAPEGEANLKAAMTRRAELTASGERVTIHPLTDRLIQLARKHAVAP